MKREQVQSMTPAMCQDLGGKPQVIGDVSMCKNLAERGDGTLEGVLPPRVVATLGSKPVACDRRGTLTNIFTQEDDGTLMYALSLDDDGTLTQVGMELCRLEQKVVQGAGAGEFLVLRDSAGTLYYLTWSGGGYSWLGELPGAPEFEAEATGQISFEGYIPAVSFKGAIEDLRAGLDAESKRRVQTALLAGLDDAVSGAMCAGYRVMPALVRVAWRLWDGRLLHVSEAQLPAGVMTPPGGERVMLTVASGTKGFTGTEAGSVSVQGYRLIVRPVGEMPAPWRSVIGSVEVWVSAPDAYLRQDATVRVSAPAATGVQKLSCSYPSYTDAQARALLDECAMSLQWSSEQWGGEVSVPVDEGAAPDPLMTGVSVPAHAGIQTGGCDCILGYGGFLHVARGSSVSTSARGNPLVMLSETADVGGGVRHLWPQLSGGGAYTRQYIYAATDHGVVALTHDRDGRHTNCRLITPHQVSGVQMGMATADGLYLACVHGPMLRVKDARAEVVLRSLEGCSAVVWNARRGHLMLCGVSTSLVLQPGRQGRCFTMDFVCNDLVGCMWRRLGWYEHKLGQVSLYDLDAESSVQVTAGCAYQYPIGSPGMGGGVRRLHIGVRGEVVMAQALVLAGRGDAMKECLRVDITGSSPAGVNVWMRGAGAYRSQLEYTLMLVGSFSRFDGCRWVT